MRTLKISLITILGCFLTTQSLSKPSYVCEENPIFCKILKLAPNSDKSFAMKLSNYIYKNSKEFGTNPLISVAIAFQESSLKNKHRMGSVLLNGQLQRGETDIGVFQLHIDTIKNLKNEGHDIDFKRLKTDVEYQTYWHTKILASKIKTCKSKSLKLKVISGNEWSCYHSYTLHLRKHYLSKVSAHLEKIK